MPYFDFWKYFIELCLYNLGTVDGIAFILFFPLRLLDIQRQDSTAWYNPIHTFTLFTHSHTSYTFLLYLCCIGDNLLVISLVPLSFRIYLPGSDVNNDWAVGFHYGTSNFINYLALGLWYEDPMFLGFLTLVQYYLFCTFSTVTIFTSSLLIAIYSHYYA